MSTALVVLAGGQGSRLGGVRKALLTLQDRPFLDHVLDRLCSGCAPVLVATGPEPLARPLPAPALAVPDLDTAHRGPTAGLIAAARRLEGRQDIDHVLTASVDCPLVPVTLRARLLAALEPHENAVSVVAGGRFEPLFSLYRYAAFMGFARMAPDAALPGPRALLSTMKAQRFDWPDHREALGFASINTPQDLEDIGGSLPEGTVPARS